MKVKFGKLISSLAILAATAAVSVGIGQTAAANDSGAEEVAKSKPPVVYSCDRIAYAACVAGGQTPQACAAATGCMPEEN